MSIEFNIYYSTHSGTSEGFAKQIQVEFKKYGITNKVESIQELSIQKFKTENHFIFLISTHFNGGSCADGELFYEWIQIEKGKPNFSTKKFTMFGLGD